MREPRRACLSRLVSGRALQWDVPNCITRDPRFAAAGALAVSAAPCPAAGRIAGARWKRALLGTLPLLRVSRHNGRFSAMAEPANLEIAMARGRRGDRELAQELRRRNPVATRVSLVNQHERSG